MGLEQISGLLEAEILKQMKEKSAELEKKIVDMETQIKQKQQHIINVTSNFEKQASEKLAGLDKQFESRFQGVEKRTKSLEDRTVNVESRCAKSENKFKGIGGVCK